VVATTALVADLVRNIAGPNRVQVVSLMGEGVDPHMYKGSPRDVRDLAGADLVVAGGLHLEGKLIGVLHRLGRQKPVHLLGDELTALAESKKLPDPWIRDDGMPDPHCWFDVSLWQREAELFSHILSDYDPNHASEFQTNLKNYSAELVKLDSEIRQNINQIPADRRLLVTSHDAFRYFGRAYGIQVEGIQGLSTESESGVRRTNQLVDLSSRAVFQPFLSRQVFLTTMSKPSSKGLRLVVIKSGSVDRFSPSLQAHLGSRKAHMQACCDTMCALLCKP